MSVCEMGSKVSAEIGSVLSFRQDGSCDVDVTRSPSAIERIGQEIADRIRPMQVDVLFTWDNAGDGILGHIVARQLGIRVALFRVDEGLIEADSTLVRGCKVGLVVVNTPHCVRYDALRGFISSQDGILVVTVELIGTRTAADDLSRIVFVDRGEIE